MEEGGNTNFRVFLEKFDLYEIDDIKIKYKTKAAAYYRRMLEAKVNQQNFIEIEPSRDEGRSLIDGRRLDENGNVVNVEVIIADNE